MPEIVAKYGSRCRKCGLQIVAGERIDYSHSNGALHLTCANGTDPQLGIVESYQLHRKYGCDDQQAFDECVEEFGYTTAVKALYEVSPLAKQKEDAYRVRVASATQYRINKYLRRPYS